MAYQFVSYDDAPLQPGKFYTLRVNKDQATATIEAPPSPIHFTNSSYINEPWNGVSSIEIWKSETYKTYEKVTNITHSVDWHILKPDNRIVINSSQPITGYIKFI